MATNEPGILKWLHKGRMPSDLYEMLGVARFDPDVPKLRNAVRRAMRDLANYREHQNPQRARQVAPLRQALEQADLILASSSNLRAYHSRMLKSIEQMDRKRRGNAGPGDSGEVLKQWLETQIQVHPKQLDAVVRAIHATRNEAGVQPRQDHVETKFDPKGREPVADADTLGGWSPPANNDPTGLIRQARQSATASQRRMPTAWLLAAIALVAVVVAIAVWMQKGDPTSSRRPPQTLRSTTVNRSGATRVSQTTAEANRTTTLESNQAVETLQHASVEPSSLDLRLLPPGSRMLLALRPARLKNDPAARDLVRGLGRWAERSLEFFDQFVRLDTGDVGYALIGLVPGSTGEPPRAAAVLHLAREVPRTDLLEAFGRPEPSTIEGKQVYVDSATYTAYYFADPTTVAILPERFAREVLRDVSTPQPTSREIESLVPLSNREAIFNLIFDVRFLRDESEQMLEAADRELVEHALDWLSEETAAGLLSVDPGASLEVSLAVHGARDVRPARQRSLLENRLRHMPYDLLAAVQTMQPPERTRRLIGRFPAMVKALALMWRVEVEAGNVVARARLPERAGPNLALAGRLTWQEYQRNDTSSRQHDK